MKTIKTVLTALVMIAFIAGGFTAGAKTNGLSASFTADVNTGAAPLTVHFKDTSGGNPSGWHWDFGDNASSTLQDPVYTYNTPGRYTVTLTVTDGVQSDTASADIVVTNTLVTTPTPTTTPVIVQPIIVPIKDPHHAQPPAHHPPAPKHPGSTPTLTPGDKPRHR